MTLKKVISQTCTSALNLNSITLSSLLQLRGNQPHCIYLLLRFLSAQPPSASQDSLSPHFFRSQGHNKHYCKKPPILQPLLCCLSLGLSYQALPFSMRNQ